MHEHSREKKKGASAEVVYPPPTARPSTRHGTSLHPPTGTEGYVGAAPELLGVTIGFPALPQVAKDPVRPLGRKRNGPRARFGTEVVVADVLAGVAGVYMHARTRGCVACRLFVMMRGARKAKRSIVSWSKSFCFLRKGSRLLP